MQTGILAKNSFFPGNILPLTVILFNMTMFLISELIMEVDIGLKRKEWDSNPRYPHGYTRSPGVPVKPLLHLSEFGMQIY